VHSISGWAEAWDSGKLVRLHSKFIAKTFEPGIGLQEPTDLDYGGGTWRTIEEKILRKIDSGGGIWEPGRVLGWRCCGINYTGALVADDLGVIPDVRPEEVDAGCRPVVKILVRLELQTMFLVDLVQESEEPGRVVRVNRDEERHGRVSDSTIASVPRAWVQSAESLPFPPITRLFECQPPGPICPYKSESTSAHLPTPHHTTSPTPTSCLQMDRFFAPSSPEAIAHNHLT
jgi:hypothetical protein